MQDPPRRKFTSVRQRNPPHVFTSHCPKPHEAIDHKPLYVKHGEPQNDYCPFFFVHEELNISFQSSERSNEQPIIEEHVVQQGVNEEKNNELVPILIEKNLAFYPRAELEGLL